MKEKLKTIAQHLVKCTDAREIEEIVRVFTVDACQRTLYNIADNVSSDDCYRYSSEASSYDDVIITILSTKNIPEL